MHRLTIVHTGKPEITLDELVVCGEDMGIDVEVCKVTDDMIQFGEITEKFGDGVLWRLSEIGMGGLAAFYGAMEGKETINPALYVYPELADKFFQQSLLLYSDLRDYYVMTLRVNGEGDLRRYLDEGRLSFPFVVKPARGYSGMGVRLIANEGDLSGIGGGCVAQSYIENSGDWRVFVVGGVGIGAMKKVAEEGRPFNFVTGRAHISKEEDEEVLRELNKIACKAASLFKLGCTGVDIIRDDGTGDYKLLEVNFSPGWQNGWDKVTGQSVPKEVMSWYKERWAAKDGEFWLAAKKYLETRLERLTREKRALLARGVEYDFWGSLDEWEKDVRDNYFTKGLEEKLRFLYFCTKDGRQTDLKSVVLGEAEQSVSWAGNFLVDVRSETETGLSVAHNLEDGAVATVLYVKIHEMLEGVEKSGGSW